MKLLPRQWLNVLLLNMLSNMKTWILIVQSDIKWWQTVLTDLHTGVILKEEQDHALIDWIHPIIHSVIESGGQEDRQQPPGAPGQQVSRSGTQHHGRREPVTQRVRVHN